MIQKRTLIFCFEPRLFASHTHCDYMRLKIVFQNSHYDMEKNVFLSIANAKNTNITRITEQIYFYTPYKS